MFRFRHSQRSTAPLLRLTALVFLMSCISLPNHLITAGASNNRVNATRNAINPAAPLQSGYYTITDLGTLGGTRSQSYGVNATGQVTGFSLLSGGVLGSEHAFLYSDSTMTDLGTLGGTQSRGADINDSGQIAGESRITGDGATHAFLYSGGTITDLGTLGGTHSYGYAVNNSGTVVGSSLFSGGGTNRHAFRWTSAGGMQDLGTLGGAQSSASAINAAGDIAGSARIVGNKATHAALWASGGGVTDLGTLGGTYSYGNGINDSNQVVGYSNIPGNARDHAFLWTSGGGMQDIGTLGGYESYAFDINNNGQVVGWSYISGNTNSRAFIYDAANGMRNLNNLIPSGSGWILVEARSVNDAGQITGYGTINGQYHAFLLTPANGNLPPTANNQSVTTTQNTPKNITLTASDPNGDPLIYTVLTNPANGTLSGTAPNLTYTPYTGFTGSDSFTFKVNDGTNDSNIATVSITVNPSGSGTGTISTLTLTPAIVTGGCQTSTGKVTLSAAAPAGGTTVMLSSSNAAASVPPSVIVPAGQTSANFTITTANVSTQQRPVITAKLGTSQKTATLTVKPIALQSLTLNPTTVKGGTSSTGTVTLSCVSSAGSTIVTLKSSLPSAAQPAVSQITIPAGSQTGTFQVTTSPVTSNTSVTVTATANGLSKTAKLTVTP